MSFKQRELIGTSLLFHTKYSPLKGDIKEKWLSMLKKGDYTKVNQFLKQGDGFCALGVLCELYRQQHPENSRWMYVPAKDAYIFVLNNENPLSYSTLPSPVREWAGFPKCHIYQSVEEEYIWRLNDDNDSFDEVIDWIEENL